jgi:hypothetical protein
MGRIASIAGAFCALALAWLAPAPAGGAHLFVSHFGNDTTGTGTPFAPFATLQRAVDLANSGDVIQLELGGNYGAATIDNKSLTIVSNHGGGIFEPGGPALTFNSGSGNDTLTLRGLTIDQAGSANNGIMFNSGRKLNVLDTTIQNGSGGSSGIFFRPNTNAELNLRNTTINEFGTAGGGSAIRIEPRNGADVISAMYASLLSNSRTGIRSVAGAGSNVNVLVRDMDIVGGATGISSSGPGSVVRVRDSAISNNQFGLTSQNGGQILTGGFNSVVANTANENFTGTYSVK